MLREWNLTVFQKLMDYTRGGTGSIGRPKLVDTSYRGTEWNRSQSPDLDSVDVYVDFILISC